MNKTTIGKLIFYGFIALLFLSELGLSSFGGLQSDLAASAASNGIEVQTLRLYLIGLGIIDVLGGIGTGLAIAALIRPGPNVPGRLGALLTTAALVLYAAYQVAFEQFAVGLVANELYIMIAVLYLVLALISWPVGGSLRNPEPSTKKEEPSRSPSPGG